MFSRLFQAIPNGPADNTEDLSVDDEESSSESDDDDEHGDEETSKTF